MTFYPNRTASRSRSSQINRVAKISQRDAIDPTPDTLCLIKREVDTLDQLKISSPATFNARIALLTDARTKQLFFGGNADMLRYRFYIYGEDKATLQSVLTALFKINYGKVGAWYRLAASTAVTGEWPSVVDVLNTNPMVQTQAVRKAAVGTSTNGLPTMLFDGTDIHLLPLIAQNFNINKIGYWFWFRPANVASLQTIFRIAAIAGGANLNAIELYAQNSQVLGMSYLSGSNVNGRSVTTPVASLAINTWASIYFQYDASRGGDDNMRVYVNTVLPTQTYGNINAGGTLTTLNNAIGNGFTGGANDSDTPASAIGNGGQIGNNTFVLLDNLTGPEMTNMQNFETPTG